jgi:formamidopyrimidine-DNA glycosylase
MIELPECLNLAAQLERWTAGKTVATAEAAASAHKFAWYSGDPADYGRRLAGAPFAGADAVAHFLRVRFGSRSLVFAEGIALRACEAGAERPEKHQLLLEFDDGSALAAGVQMYGGLWLAEGGDIDNPYFRRAREAASPLGDGFTPAYFRRLPAAGLAGKTAPAALSAKALLASDQRVPGLGNGCVQDILWTARLHPRRKAASFTDAEWDGLYAAVRSVLRDMADRGGRDTERDLFGAPGGYRTVASKNTVGAPCPRCGAPIAKEAYMGGSVYFCPGCQAD